MNFPLRILIAPLDWGLGHTTRCIPVIAKLLANGHLVTFAGHPTAISLIQKTFPQLKCLPLEGYNITYSKNRFSFVLGICLQIPKILRQIKKEHQWLKDLLKKEEFDLIISDNRYGLYSDKLPAIIMTHQLRVLTGMGNLPDLLLQKLHYRFLNKFTRCWVVDQQAGGGLAGKLSHSSKIPSNASYIGLLSQFSIQKPEVIPPEQKPGDLTEILILLSGPEPQRSILEKKLAQKIKGLIGKYRFVFISGKPGSQSPLKEDLPAYKYFPVLSAQELAPLFKRADMVICRSGYSTLMDLAYYEKKALLIPTPGQTEQEYLGKYLSQKGFGIVMNQSKIDLENGIRVVLKLSEIKLNLVRDDLLERAVQKIVQDKKGG